MSARAHIGTADKGVFTKCYLQEVPRRWGFGSAGLIEIGDRG